MFTNLTNIRYALRNNNAMLFPGQYKRIGSTNIFGSNTYIQNNFFGMQKKFGDFDYDYGCCGGNKMSTLEKITMWTGITSALAGLVCNIAGLFKKNKTDGNGGAETPVANQNNDALTKLQEQIDNLKKDNEALKAKLEQPVNTTPTTDTPEVEEEVQKVDDGNGAGSGVGNGNGIKLATKQYNTTYGWYAVSSDKMTGTSNQFEGVTTTAQLVDRLVTAKTNGKEGAASTVNANLITAHKSEIQQAIIQANPNMFDANGNLLSGKDIKDVKIPDMQWIADTFGTGTKSPTGNGRTVHRNENGKTITKAADGVTLSDEYVNAKEYSVKTKSGDKFKVKIGENGTIWYYNKDGKAVSEKDFKALTGLTGAQIKAKINKPTT